MKKLRMKSRREFLVWGIGLLLLVLLAVSCSSGVNSNVKDLSKMNEPKYTNRLINETSPYLLQHAHNPVDWYPWGTEALELARQRDVPILLSIGYSACHWCHVMEHESFENEEIAQLMNKNFVCIKVDREERPDLDDIYMKAVQAIMGSGGWPMTVFLTPDLKPFFGGTYFPPQDIQGRPGFRTILTSVSEYFRQNREKVESHSDQVASVIQQMSEFQMSEESLSPDMLVKAYRQMKSIYDPEHGGLGSAPKFPQPMSLSLLMRYWKRSEEAEALEMVEYTLRKMAQGGMYDQLGGGFHRYSVDEKWLVPHFEKMLYDNALLAHIYLEAYQITKEELYCRIASETLDYVLREMYRPKGGFYSTQDADTEGEEGKTYVWSLDEVKEILGDEAQVFARYYGLTENGNFEHGTNILNISDSPDDIAQELGISIADLNTRIQGSKARLLQEREKRVQPGLDDKILTAWNGLMISSMAAGYQILGNEKYLDAAIQSAEFILARLSRDGMLLRTFRNNESKLNAYVDDYAFLIGALIDLYESDFQIKWLNEAVRLNQTLIDEFWDEQDGGFFYTGDSHEKLILRSKSAYDGALPSGNSVAAMNLLRLARFTGDGHLAEMAESILKIFKNQMDQAPAGFSQMLSALDFYLSDPKEIAVIGKDTKEIISIIRDHYIPNKILVSFDPENGPKDIENSIPLLKGRTTKTDGKPTVYICENYVCKAPITDLELLKEALSAHNP